MRFYTAEAPTKAALELALPNEAPKWATKSANQALLL